MRSDRDCMPPLTTGFLRRRQIILGIVIASVYYAIIEFNEYNLARGQDEDNNVIKPLNNLSLGSLGAPARISFQLDRRDIEDEAGNYQEKIEGDGYNYYRCQGAPGRTDRLPPSLEADGVLNFSTAITTDLKILVLGDSVGGQLARVLYESTGVSFEDQKHIKHPSCATKKVLLNFQVRESLDLHGMTIAAPIRGGGVMAFWRITSLLSMTGRTTGPPGFAERLGRWNKDQPSLLLNQSYSASANSSCNYEIPNHNNNILKDKSSEKKVGSFDVVIMRVPHGWMRLKFITRSALLEAIHLCRRYLGVDTVILQTIPFTNNIATPNDWKKMSRINNLIREVAYNVTAEAAEYPLLMPTYVLVQEFANFTSQLIYENARHIGYNLTSPTSAEAEHNLFSLNGWEQQNTDFLFDKIPGTSKFEMSIPQVCASKLVSPPSNTSGDVFPCQKNLISNDGLHLCSRTIAAKFSASIACLLGCVYNGNLVRFYHDVIDFPQKQTVEKIQQCQQSCNDQFMSITPVKNDWIETDVAHFSHS